MSANGRSFVVSPQALLGAACVPCLVGLILLLGPETAYVGSGGLSADAGSRVRAVREAAPPKVSLPPTLIENSDPFPRPAPALPTAAAPGKDVSQPAGLAAPLLARCSAILPRADVLISLGDRADALSASEAAQEKRLAVANRLERDLDRVKTQRVLIYADMERLQWVQTRDEMHRVAPPVADDLSNLTLALKPVQADLRALRASAGPAPATVPPPAETSAKTRVASPRKAPFNPHLASPAADEPQFAMPTGAGAASP